MTDDVAATLDELSEYFKLDGQRGYAAAYSQAADAVRTAQMIPANPAEINGVGDTVRGDIVEYQRTGEIERLQELKERHEYYEAFRSIDGVGPITSRNVHDELGINSKSALEAAIHDGRILDVDGIGEKTAENILQNI